MEIRKVENNNLCEHYNKELGCSVWVQSDETGLWFNMNDVLKMFNLSKNEFKRNLRLNGEDNDKRIIEFYRGNEKFTEYFISEPMVHEVIAINRGKTQQEERFIYDIIMDYDVTCLNDNEQNLNTKQRIALQALQIESNSFIQKSKEYMNLLKDTNIPDVFKDFENEIKKEMNDNKPSYDNKYVPVDIYTENRIKEVKESRDNGINTVNRSLIEAVDLLTKITDNEYMKNLKEYDEDIDYLYNDISEVSWEELGFYDFSFYDELNSKPSDNVIK